VSDSFDVGSAIARLTPGRPLLIVDADEVVLRFVDGFDRFLRAQGLFLDLTSYRLHGNVKRLDDRQPVLDVEVSVLLEDFRKDLDSLEPVDGAHASLTALASRLDVVVLTNIVPWQAPPRLRNLAAIGLDLPLVANSGHKGPAVKALAVRAGRPAFFIDDIPQNLASAAEAAPEIIRIHLIGDDRLKPLLPPAPHAHLRAEHWRDAHVFIDGKLTEAGM
jgi:FMN phosphatase YigB (HAD superfamily)